jgi:hypothetical protein
VNAIDCWLIFYQKKYHWAWSIPLDEDVVSVRIVCPSAYLLGKKESKRDSYIRELRELHPELSSRIPEMDSAVKVSSVLGTRIGLSIPVFPSV